MNNSLSGIAKVYFGGDSPQEINALKKAVESAGYIIKERDENEPSMLQRSYSETDNILNDIRHSAVIVVNEGASCPNVIQEHKAKVIALNPGEPYTASNSEASVEPDKSLKSHFNFELWGHTHRTRVKEILNNQDLTLLPKNDL